MIKILCSFFGLATRRQEPIRRYSSYCVEIKKPTPDTWTARRHPPWMRWVWRNSCYPSWKFCRRTMATLWKPCTLLLCVHWQIRGSQAFFRRNVPISRERVLCNASKRKEVRPFLLSCIVIIHYPYPHYPCSQYYATCFLTSANLARSGHRQP